MKWSEKSLSYGLTDLSHSNEIFFDVRQYTSVIWKKKKKQSKTKNKNWKIKTTFLPAIFILKRTNPVWNAKHRIWLWFKIKIKLFFHWIDTICSDTWTRLTKCECSENWVYDQATVRKRIRYWSETLYVFFKTVQVYIYIHMHITDRSSCMFENAINECVVCDCVCFGFLRRIYLFFH